MLTATDWWKLQALQLKAQWLQTTPLQIGLFTNPYTPTRSSVLGDFVQPTIFTSALLTGPLVFGVPYINAAGFAQMDRTTLAQWTPAAITAGQMIYGYFIYYPGLGQILWAERNPLGPLLYGTTFLPYVLQVTFSDSQFNPTLP